MQQAFNSFIKQGKPQRERKLSEHDDLFCPEPLSVHSTKTHSKVFANPGVNQSPWNQLSVETTPSGPSTKIRVVLDTVSVAQSDISAGDLGSDSSEPEMQQSPDFKGNARREDKVASEETIHTTAKPQDPESTYQDVSSVSGANLKKAYVPKHKQIVWTTEEVSIQLQTDPPKQLVQIQCEPAEVFTGQSDILTDCLQDSQLLDFVSKFGQNSWNRISKLMPGKSEIKCHTRYLQLKNVNNCNSGTWTKQEDQILTQKVHELGATNWTRISKFLPGRIGKQCRERWHNHLDPNIKKVKWSQWEDAMIVKLHKEIGNKWCDISKQIPGRSDNAIKNRFNSNLKRKLAAGKTFPHPDDASKTPALPASKNRNGANLNVRKRDLKMLDKQQSAPNVYTQQISSAASFDGLSSLLDIQQKQEIDQTQQQIEGSNQSRPAITFRNPEEVPSLNSSAESAISLNMQKPIQQNFDSELNNQRISQPRRSSQELTPSKLLPLERSLVETKQSTVISVGSETATKAEAVKTELFRRDSDTPSIKDTNILAGPVASPVVAKETIAQNSLDKNSAKPNLPKPSNAELLQKLKPFKMKLPKVRAFRRTFSDRSMSDSQNLFKNTLLKRLRVSNLVYCVPDVQAFKSFQVAGQADLLDSTAFTSTSTPETQKPPLSCLSMSLNSVVQGH